MLRNKYEPLFLVVDCTKSELQEYFRSIILKL